MRRRTRKLKALKRRIMVAQRRRGSGLGLAREVAAFCRERRRQGVRFEEVANELEVAGWQLADWLQQGASGKQGRQRRRLRKSKTPMFEVKVPATARFERLLAREAARALQKCDSCCWKKLVDSLPSEFLNGKEDAES